MKSDFEYGMRDAKIGIYDKWYRYNRSDDGAEYDAGHRIAMQTWNCPPQQIIECI